MTECSSLFQFVRRNPYGVVLWFCVGFNVVTRWVL